MTDAEKAYEKIKDQIKIEAFSIGLDMSMYEVKRHKMICNLSEMFFLAKIQDKKYKKAISIALIHGIVDGNVIFEQIGDIYFTIHRL